MSFSPPTVGLSSIAPEAERTVFFSTFCVAFAPITRPSGNTSSALALSADANGATIMSQSPAVPIDQADPLVRVEGVDMLDEE